MATASIKKEQKYLGTKMEQIMLVAMDHGGNEAAAEFIRECVNYFNCYNNGGRLYDKYDVVAVNCHGILLERLEKDEKDAQLQLMLEALHYDGYGIYRLDVTGECRQTFFP